MSSTRSTARGSFGVGSLPCSSVPFDAVPWVVLTDKVYMGIQLCVKK